jgi:hypothetical protein
VHLHSRCPVAWFNGLSRFIHARRGVDFRECGRSQRNVRKNSEGSAHYCTVGMTVVVCASALAVLFFRARDVRGDVGVGAVHVGIHGDEILALELGYVVEGPNAVLRRRLFGGCVAVSKVASTQDIQRGKASQVGAWDGATIIASNQRPNS